MGSELTLCDVEALLEESSENNKTRACGYKTFFMLNSAEREILNAHKYRNIKKISSFQALI